MNTSGVTKQGQQGDRPDREALTGVNAGPDPARPQREGRRRASEQPTSYYGRPILHQPTWEALDIAGYFFLGGLAGASSVLAAGAQATGRPALARSAKAGAAGAISLSLVALIHDLGRPARFLNMLRVFKPTSPMSVGVWILFGYAPAAIAAAASDLTGIAPVAGSAATAGAAALGPAVASYTGVLLSNTAVPAWHEGHRETPFVFAGSAASAAAGLGLLSAPGHQSGPARRLAAAGAIAELTAAKLMERRLGKIARPYQEGRAGRLMRLSEGLTAAGALTAVTAGRRSRVAQRVAGAALLTASACTRFGIFEAGRVSAADPAYTVEPQASRRRDAARAA